LSLVCTLEEITPTRGTPVPAQLAEHLQATAKRLKNLGIRPGDFVASLLPESADAALLQTALAILGARYVPITGHEPVLSACKLLLLHPGDNPRHPALQTASSLGIPVVHVLRHFEAGIFTLERSLHPLPSVVLQPAWKEQLPGVPLVLLAPVPAYRRLADRLDSSNPVIGITAPSLEHLPPPHTIEHIAAECVRMLRRSRLRGPYAIGGWEAHSVVALEMARLLEEGGNRVVFVAMLDASHLFGFRRKLQFFRKKYQPSCEFMATALRQYRPRPWYGKILHIQATAAPARAPLFDWNHIAPHGFASYEASPKTADETVAGILATELR
jgi:hypothetical protein